MVLYIYEKFPNNISNGFQLTEWTRVHGRNGHVQCSKGKNSKSRQTRIYFCENISDGMERPQMMEELTYGRKDRQTDTQNFRGFNIIPHHFLWWGI